MSGETDVLTHERNAYVLARDNIHKPWARRWLRDNGHHTTLAVYKERQRKAKR